MSNSSPYFIVYNIPPNYRTVDLRSHFSSWVEASRFALFHFKHRKDEKISAEIEKTTLDVTKRRRVDDRYLNL
jgi:hypothetical protein